MSPLSRQMFRFITAEKKALGANYGGFKIARDDGQRVLNILDTDGYVITSVAVDRWATFHHPSSPFYAGA